jgi:hypothetical protein
VFADFVGSRSLPTGMLLSGMLFTIGGGVASFVLVGVFMVWLDEVRIEVVW